MGSNRDLWQRIRFVRCQYLLNRLPSPPPEAYEACGSAKWLRGRVRCSGQPCPLSGRGCNPLSRDRSGADKVPHVLTTVAEQARAVILECLDEPLAPKAFLLQDAKKGLRFSERRNAPTCPNPRSRFGGRILWQRVSPFHQGRHQTCPFSFLLSLSSSFSPRVRLWSRKPHHCSATHEGELRGELLRFPLSYLFPLPLNSKILRIENRVKVTRNSPTL